LHGRVTATAQYGNPGNCNRRSSWLCLQFRSSPSLLPVLWTGPLNSTDLVLFCDALLTRLGFWAPSLSQGFCHSLHSASTGGNILWFEALAVASAIEFAASLASRPSRLAVFTDSLDTVQMFDSLRASSIYNPILLSTCALLMSHSMDLRVFHIAGDRNVVADALSRGLVHVAMLAQPRLRLSSFQPPPLVPGVLPPPPSRQGRAQGC